MSEPTGTAFDVAVIGAGVAGLAAATALAESGRRVLVVEARGELGGRATAFVDRETGELVDNGQHVLFGCYRETFRLLRRIGAEGHVRVQPSLEVPYLDLEGRRSVLRCPPLPSPLHLVAGILGWNALSWPDRLSILRVAAPLMAARRALPLPSTRARSLTPGNPATARSAPRQADADADQAQKRQETVDAWLTRHGQRGRLREWLWEPLAVAALNQSPKEAAAGPFVRVLAEMFGPSRADSSLVLPLTPLHEMYAVPAMKYIEARGGLVRVNALARVRIDEGAVTGIEIRGEAPIAVSRVIAAVPWFALEALLIGEVAPMASITAAASRMTSKAIVTVNLWYDRTVMDDLFVGLPGREMQWVFDKRRVFGETASHLSLVASGADALAGSDNATLIGLAAREVAASIPGARDAVLRRGTVIREKRATFSLAPGEPARPGVATPIRGLALAGDWIETGLPGTIESAAASGHMAAASLQP